MPTLAAGPLAASSLVPLAKPILDAACRRSSDGMTRLSRAYQWDRKARQFIRKTRVRP